MARLRVGLRGDQIDQIIVEFRHVHQLGPGPGQGRAELGHEMRHPCLSTRDAISLEQAHLRPADAKAHTDRLVDLSGGGDAVLDQPQCLAPDGLQQAVGDMGVDLLADGQGIHADTAQDVRCPSAGVCITDQFDQRQQIDRVERMGDDGPGAHRVQFGRLEARGGGPDDRIRASRLRDHRQDAVLDLQDLGNAFLHPVCAGDRRSQIGMECQTSFGGKARS